QHFLRSDGRPALGWISASIASGARDRSFARVLELDESGERGSSRALKGADEIDSLLDDFFDGVMVTDENGRIASFNRGAQRLFGYQTREILGREAKAIIAEPYQGEFGRYLDGWMRPGRETAATSGSREMWGRRKDGSTFPIEFRATRMFLGGEERFVGILRDISEQKAQTEALEYQTLHDVLTS